MKFFPEVKGVRQDEIMEKIMRRLDEIDTKVDKATYFNKENVDARTCIRDCKANIIAILQRTPALEAEAETSNKMNP